MPTLAEIYMEKGMQVGFKEGLQKSRQINKCEMVEIATRMLLKGYSFAEISEIANLSVEEISKLSAENISMISCELLKNSTLLQS